PGGGDRSGQIGAAQDRSGAREDLVDLRRRAASLWIRRGGGEVLPEHGLGERQLREEPEHVVPGEVPDPEGDVERAAPRGNRRVRRRGLVELAPRHVYE